MKNVGFTAKRRMSFFDKLFDTIAWIKIFLSPFLVGLIIGGIMWLGNDSILFKIISVGVVLVGVAGGIFFAERVRKKLGTQEFDAKILATPELEKKQEEEK